MLYCITDKDDIVVGHVEASSEEEAIEVAIVEYCFRAFMRIAWYGGGPYKATDVTEAKCQRV